MGDALAVEVQRVLTEKDLSVDVVIPVRLFLVIWLAYTSDIFRRFPTHPGLQR